MIKNSKLNIFSFFLFLQLFVLLKGSHDDFSDDEMPELEPVDFFDSNNIVTPIDAVMAGYRFSDVMNDEISGSDDDFSREELPESIPMNGVDMDRNTSPIEAFLNESSPTDSPVHMSSEDEEIPELEMANELDTDRAPTQIENGYDYSSPESDESYESDDNYSDDEEQQLESIWTDDSEGDLTPFEFLGPGNYDNYYRFRHEIANNREQLEIEPVNANFMNRFATPLAALLAESVTNRAATPLADLLAESPSAVTPAAHTPFHLPEEEEIIRPCSICCDSLEINYDSVATKCGHLFHRGCLYSWFQNKYFCPVCRSDLSSMNEYSKREDFEAFVSSRPVESLSNKEAHNLIDLLIYAEFNGFNSFIPKILDALILKGGIDWNKAEVFYGLMQLMAIAIKNDKVQNYEAIWNGINLKNFEMDILELIRGTSKFIKNESYKICVPSLVKFAIYLGADVNNTDEKTGKTAIELTATDDQLESFKMILDSGSADITKTDPDGMTILHSAIASGHLEVAKTILNLETPFYKGQIQNILNHLDNQGRSPLYIAFNNGHHDIFKKLVVDHNADLNQKCVDGLSILEIIVKICYHQEIFDLFKFILEKEKADLTAIDQNGKTILHSAIDSGDFKVVKTILRLESPFYKAQIQSIINLLDNQGRSPLYLAMIKNNPEIFKLLLVDHYADLDQNCPNGLSTLETIIRDCKNDLIFGIILEFIQVDMPKFESAVKFAREHPEYENSSPILAKENEMIAENEKVSEIIKISKEILETPAATEVQAQVETEFDLENFLNDENSWQRLPEAWQKIVANNQIEEAFDIVKNFDSDKKFIFFFYPDPTKEFVIYMLKSDRRDEFLDFYFDPYIGSRFPFAEMISCFALLEGIQEERTDEYLRNSKYGPSCFYNCMLSCFSRHGDIQKFNNLKAKWEQYKFWYMFSSYTNQEARQIIKKCDLNIQIHEIITSNDENAKKEILENINLFSESETFSLILIFLRNCKFDFIQTILEKLDETKLREISCYVLDPADFELLIKFEKLMPENLKTFFLGTEMYINRMKRRLKFVNLEILPGSDYKNYDYNVCYNFQGKIDDIEQNIRICPSETFRGSEIIDDTKSLNFLSSGALLDYIKLTTTLVPDYHIKAYYERHTYGPGIVQLIANSEEVMNLLISLNIVLPVNNEAIAQLKLERKTKHIQDLPKILKPEELNLAFSKNFEYLENLEIITGKDIVTLLNESKVISEIEIDPYEYKKYRHIFNYMMTKSPQSIHKINLKFLKKIIGRDFGKY